MFDAWLKLLPHYIHFGVYDLLLVLVVTAMGTGVAYVRHPFWKSFILLLPIPSSMALLALQQPLNVACIFGILLLLIYFRMTAWLYCRCRFNIVAAIALSTVLFVLLGGLLKPWVTTDSRWFWIACPAVLLFCTVLYRVTPSPEESGQRTTMTVYLKVPLLLLTCLVVVAIKSWLGGFVIMFPIVGVVGAYEMRSCLNTVYRQTLLYGVTFSPLAAVCYLLQDRWGIPAALGMGWLAYLMMLWLLRRCWFPPSDNFDGNQTEIENNRGEK